MFSRKHEVLGDGDSDIVTVTFDDKVYDVTEFVKIHPGGENVLRKHKGRNVSDVMTDPAIHKHTQAAFNMLKQYYIGTVDELNIPSKNLSKNLNNNTVGNETENHHNHEGKELEKNSINHFHQRQEAIPHDGLVDWTKPMLWQVGSLGEKYYEWVHQPVTHPIRLFESDVVESLSKSTWRSVLMAWIPVMVIYMVLSLKNFSHSSEQWLPALNGGLTVSLIHFPLLLLVGALMWSFIEYMVHRYLFHMNPPSTSPLLITMHFILHGQHHKVPMDHERLVFPPGGAAFFGITISVLYLNLFPLAMAQALLAGTCFGYMIYDLTHYYLHHGEPYFRYFKDLKRYHVMHHYTDQENGFGISHKLWDYVFGTVIRKKKC